jgi:hypothetical protein
MSRETAFVGPLPYFFPPHLLWREHSARAMLPRTPFVLAIEHLAAR